MIYLLVRWSCGPTATMGFSRKLLLENFKFFLLSQEGSLQLSSSLRGTLGFIIKGRWPKKYNSDDGDSASRMGPDDGYLIRLLSLLSEQQNSSGKLSTLCTTAIKINVFQSMLCKRLPVG